MLLFQRAVGGLPCKVKVNKFDPAAGFKVPRSGAKYLVESTPRRLGVGTLRFGRIRKDLHEALVHESRPVLDCVSHEATVNIIKFLAIRPFGFDVVNFEADVWRYPAADLNVCYKRAPKVKTIPARLNRA